MDSATFLQIAKAVVSNPAFAAQGQVTFCNFAAQLITNAVFGYSGFDGLNANQIYNLVSGSGNWLKVDGSTAQLHANGGHLAICSQVGQPHGHVSVIVPGNMVPSEHFGHAAPLTANVGELNAIVGANWGFSVEPGYFVLAS